MSSVSYDPFHLPVRILAFAGLAGLAALTLVTRGATRMYATPWVLVFAAVTALPPLILLLRLASSRQPVRLPSPGWLVLAVATIAVPIASALASPYREPSLLVAAGPVAAACLFLLIHDWLQENPAPNRARLEQVLIVAAGAIALVSAFWWLRDVFRLTHAELFSRVLFDLRNPHPLGHSNYTAGLMLLGLPLVVQAVWRARQTDTPNRLRGAGLLLAGLMLLHLFTSGSRGGMIGLGVLGVLGVALAGLGWKRFLLLAAGLVVLAGLFAIANPRIRSLLDTDPLAPPNVSAVQRHAMVHGGWMMGADRPLLGWGPGTTPLAYPRYRHALDGGVDTALQLHSTPIQLWAETGAASLLVALLFAGLVARNWRNAPVAAVTLAGYGTLALTDYQLDVPIFAAAVAVFSALLATPAAAPSPPRSRTGLCLLVLAATIVIVALGARDPTPRINSEALALASANEQSHPEAIALLNQSLALNPDQEIAHFNLGWLLLVPNPAQAEKHFRTAARLVPDKGGVYFGLGLARLNQGRNDEAAHAFALECLNEPRFFASPWWTVPAIAAQRDATAEIFTRMTRDLSHFREAEGWTRQQITLLASLAPRLGRVSPGEEGNYRRARLGYPVLMRNSDLAPPVDLYDVREDPRFPASVPFALPAKGWLPSPYLLKLLDDPRVALK